MKAGEGPQVVSRCSGHALLGWDIWSLPALWPELSYEVLWCNHKHRTKACRLQEQAQKGDSAAESCAV